MHFILCTQNIIWRRGTRLQQTAKGVHGTKLIKTPMQCAGNTVSTFKGLSSVLCGGNRIMHMAGWGEQGMAGVIYLRGRERLCRGGDI